MPRWIAVDKLEDAEWLRSQYETELRAGTSIAAELGCKYNRVYRALRMHGIPIRPKSRAQRLAKSGRDFDDAEAARLYLSGLGTTAIANELHASITTVMASLERQGIPRRSRQEAGRRRRDVTQRRLPIPKTLLGNVTRCMACERTDCLERHHVNADPEDNREENLVALCWEHHVLVEWLVAKAITGLRDREILAAA